MRKWNKFGVATAITLTLTFGMAGCNKQSENTAQNQGQNPDVDPASANMAPVEGAALQNESTTASSQAPPSQPAAAPAPSQTAGSENPPPPPDDTSAYPADNTVPATDVSPDQSGYYDTSAEQPIYASDPPPPIPVYDQPPCPGPNYLWTPGYWGYQQTGYYWVPGVWVIAPYVGALWTPGFWGWSGGHYRWTRGYWGPHIGYYGGINYGHGYPGRGYYGGYWNHNNFYYNRTITNVNTTVVRNVYTRNVTINNVNINNYNNSRIAYNGGRGGLTVRPTAAELAASRERHMPPLSAQVQHMHQASQNRAQFFNVNRGRPQTVALNRPLATPFHAPAAQPPVRGVANPGFARQELNRQQLQQAHPQPGQQHPVAVSGARPAPQGGLIRPGEQPGNRPGNVQPGRPGTMQERSGAHPAPVQRQEIKPQPGIQHPQPQRPAETRPAPAQQRQENRPQPQQRPNPVQERSGARPAPVQHQEIRPQPQQRPAPVQRQEQRPQQRMESRPAPAQRPESRPQQRPEEHPQSRPEEHPHGR